MTCRGTIQHLGIWLLTVSWCGISQIQAAPPVEFVPGATVPATQWEVTDISFQVVEAPESPLDVDAKAVIDGPDQQQFTIPLFYDGHERFLLRFSPPAVGEWRFSTQSNVKDLNGHSGNIQASASRDNQHGPVIISTESNRRFAYADGSSYFPIAFECDWLFALDAENQADLPKTRTLIETIARNGFNQIVMNVYAYDVTWPSDPKLPREFNYAGPNYSPFGGTNESPDFTTLNIKFFQHLDRVIAELDRHGIVSHLMIYVWNKQVNWPESRSDADNRYFDYVVKRYQAFPNLIWDVSKEATGYGHNDMAYITDRIERLRGLDAFDRLVTVHDYGYCSKHADKVDFISIQNWTSELWSAMNNVRTENPGKPIFNIEHGGYETGPYHVFTGDYLSAEACLERAYQCMFAGASLTHYWQDTSWSVVIHDPESLPEDQRPKLSYYRHLADLVSRPGFSSLEPADRKLSSSGLCLTDNNSRYTYFVPKENSAVHVRLPKNVGKTVKLSWFNPHTGEVTPLPPEAWRGHIEVPAPGWDHFGILIADLE
ncbi:MAG: DUF4038 domain-containing protein [Planctomycetaceae bacterium]|nr:DUF4038 domain-containing protein [Planctomycetaceae bacterium]MCB9951818.1 DUF4038 domain-containing protein [Planctomycetaceae bacterium]